MGRVVADCREYPSEIGCTLTIAGERDEVLQAAVEHAVSTHGEKDSAELRDEIGKLLRSETRGGAIEEASQQSLDEPDERRPFKGHGHVDVVKLETVTVGRGVFEPGWRWSNDVRPIAGTESCMAAHTGYVLRGRMMIRMDDGTELQLRAGDAFQLPPGHDAWVEGTEVCEILDVTGFDEYAKPKQEAGQREREAPAPGP